MHITLLSTLLLLAPLALAYPPGAAFKLCNIVYNSSYIFSTPAHYATGSGTVSFDLADTSDPYQTIHCSASSRRSFNFFYGDTTYPCDPVPGNTTSTIFTFSTSGAITINQTSIFTGNDEPPIEKYLKYGSGTAELDCDNVYTQTKNWTIGQIYSVTSQTCKPAELTIPLTIVNTT